MTQTSCFKLVGIVLFAVSIIISPVAAFAQNQLVTDKETAKKLSTLKDNVETLSLEYLDAQTGSTDFMLDENYDQAIVAFTETMVQHQKLTKAYQDMHIFLSQNSTNYTKEDEAEFLGIQHEHEKSYAGIFINRGNCYALSNQETLALQDYAEAIKLAPDSGEGYFHRSMYFMRTGKLEKTKDDLNKLLEVAPNSMFAASAQEMLGVLP